MAIDFCIANTSKEAARSENYVSLTDEMQDSLKKIPHKAFMELILDLDPYGDKVYSPKEIRELIEICSLIKSSIKEKRIILFSNQLQEICNSALQQNKLIFAVGD
ncbi:hypothetical protein NQ126_028000 (plasmid) [Priestia megaterium]|uniref:hypothetical protein n=1 Tax=Priestia megaterium TaxID=1404 RepID=UPI0024466247|nr:hypothetical protein [Priestia megaterium]WRQ95761.1 hypothetical protein NQ126_028000 [Priestia megaterium]